MTNALLRHMPFSTATSASCIKHAKATTGCKISWFVTNKTPERPCYRYCLERRLRIVTRAVPVAATAAAVYEHAQAECIVCVLMHKVRGLGREGGLQPARQLLQDWLVRALAKYNLHKHGGQQNPTAVQVGT